MDKSLQVLKQKHSIIQKILFLIKQKLSKILSNNFVIHFIK